MRVLLVFGQGPVIDPISRVRAEDGWARIGTEDINFWSKNLAQAAAYLFKTGQAHTIIVMGGRTGGSAYKSEAQLISEHIRSQVEISSEELWQEDTSTNTLENLVNVCNLYLDKNMSSVSLSVLGTSFHLPRIRLLMDLFSFKVACGFSSEEVCRAQVYGQEEWWKSPVLDDLAVCMDIDGAQSSHSYYRRQKGTEQKDIKYRFQEDDVWSRALLEMPEYFLTYVARLENARRMYMVLEKINSEDLALRFDIVPDQDSEGVIRQKLSAITRKLPSRVEWLGQDWSTETKKKLQNIVAKRRNFVTS